MERDIFKVITFMFIVFYAAMPILAKEYVPQPGDPDFVGPLSVEQLEELNK